MGGCAASDCSNHSRKGHVLVKFPKNQERRKIWVTNCRRINWEPGSGAQLCLDHFEESQFESLCKDRRKLRKTAIPTLFNMPYPPPSVTNKRIREIRCPKPNTQLGRNQMNFLHALSPALSLKWCQFYLLLLLNKQCR
ncbi:THAP domain-containing protein 2-like isoform X2 [Stegodyphus dumicola]|uniref:THAP domain-containing protein 2-like isoform X2 n=1 Tax=Stegodyphus dumicola TaxID=202533 RepID=UPI0015B35F4B|nr:THAP domain-containing protein 2-like isoform X2 [Stegodyphus dumicola]